jgi:hypothetical protein
MDKEKVPIYNEKYSFIKKDKILSFVATWMEVEIIVLSEINQAQKDKYSMILLIDRILKS